MNDSSEEYVPQPEGIVEKESVKKERRQSDEDEACGPSGTAGKMRAKRVRNAAGEAGNKTQQLGEARKSSITEKGENEVCSFSSAWMLISRRCWIF